MKIEIDQHSGFCFGVVYAIEKAEKILSMGKPLYCLGDLVHNNQEMHRLESKGLVTITHDEFKKMKNVTVLIRAHGEPPETYKIAKENNIELIDATCPVVLRLQKRVKEAYNQSDPKQIVIFGKEGHAEVNGLVGQVSGNAIVVNTIDELDKINLKQPVTVFSQTTQSPQKYKLLIDELKKRMEALGTLTLLSYTNSICRQVSSRDKELRVFAASHQVVLFVSGKQSSNGKALYEVCKSVNERSYFISEKTEINAAWFKDAKTVGVCGATSTPMWLMEQIAEYVKKIVK
ncbi:MAG TPA: 4-hydroxy-3-methylbut-2-enyl diphosphate reductase [Bacteroidales bacterium]|jgi:4-hydroxy-3-methylbut-2-enyl diphosphate reductase|nr:4-hydroxy-3-methylbut-2-enyl diphosphate reductase [Bacteroidales bacterium]HOU98181.1 4-hydroxy-3-methylbut-2-enyl diphosphate reductase [Bacteroidales bacterium]